VIARLALLAGVAAALGALVLLGFFDFIRDPEKVRAVLEGLGPWAPLIYVVSFALLEPFFVPGIVFMAPGALIWPFPELFAYSLLGAVCAGVVGFFFARYLARDYARKHLPEGLRLWDDRLERAGLRTVVLVRLTFFLAPPAHWLLGLSQVSLTTFVLGTAIGFAPWIGGVCWLLAEVGTTLWDWLSRQPGWLLWVGVAAVVVAWLALRRWRVVRAAARSPAG